MIPPINEIKDFEWAPESLKHFIRRHAYCGSVALSHRESIYVINDFVEIISYCPISADAVDGAGFGVFI